MSKKQLDALSSKEKGKEKRVTRDFIEGLKAEDSWFEDYKRKSDEVLKLKAELGKLLKSPSELFEEEADQFYSDTGYMMLGKDDKRGTHTRQERQDAYKKWKASKAKRLTVVEIINKLNDKQSDGKEDIQYTSFLTKQQLAQAIHNAMGKREA